jgi:hypothetical protein
MAQTSLVEMQIQQGQQLVDRLAVEGIPVTAAGWVKESESGAWFLYLATPLVGTDGAKKPAYSRVNAVIRDMQKEGIWLDLEKKVIGLNNPIAKDMAAHRDSRLPARIPTWFRGARLGELPVEEAYIYPQMANPEEVAGVNKR